jgi:uncharacterized OB-fold protein
MKEFKTITNTIRLPHKYGAGPVITRFYDGLRQGKILANVCPKCKRAYVPARSICPKCLVKMDKWVELSGTGEVVSWAYTEKEFFGSPCEPPFVTALIRLAGTDCDFLHLIGGADLKTLTKKLKKGLKVKAVFSDEKKGHMLDIKYFEPVR